MTDLSQAVWRKACRSHQNGGCVEVAANLPGVVAVRDSKRLEGGAHVIARAGDDCHAVRRQLEQILDERFGVEHTTLQVDHEGGDLLQIET